MGNQNNIWAVSPSIESILGHTFTLFFKSFPFVILVALFEIINSLIGSEWYSYLVIYRNWNIDVLSLQEPVIVKTFSLFIVAIILNLILNVFIKSFVLTGLYNAYRDGDIPKVSNLKKLGKYFLRRLTFSVLFVLLIILAVLMLLFLIYIIHLLLVALGLQTLTLIAVILLYVGLFVLFILSIVYSVYWILVDIIYMFEDVSFIDAFKRSYALVKDYWWTVFGVFIILLLIIAFLYLIFSFSDIFILRLIGEAFGSILFSYGLFVTYVALKNKKEQVVVQEEEPLVINVQ